MKNKFMAAVAILAVVAASGVARAEDSADVKALKAQAAALRKQNAALESRINKIEKTQAAESAKVNKVAAQQGAAPAPTDYLGLVTKGPLEVIADDGPICWKGICIFGGIDGGLSYATHGAPLNDKYYNGSEMLNKAGRGGFFGFNPNGLANSNVGIKGSYEILPGVSGVFIASTLFNPQSGQLQNAPGSLVEQQGVPLNLQSQNGDGSRGGQAFNDQLNVGFSSKEFGTLTFGRHRTFANDLVGAYDATGGAPAFSYMGYSGAWAGGAGYTAYTRWDNSLKYKVEYGPARFGAMYKFADGNGGTNIGNATAVTAATKFYPIHNDAGQVDLGLSYGGFDIDGVLGYYHQQINAGALGATQLSLTSGTQSSFTPPAGGAQTSAGNNAGTLTGTAADATFGAIAAKYTWNQWKFYAGWAHTILQNPRNPVGIGADSAQGGYILSSVNNNGFNHTQRVLDTEWGGVRYSWDPKTDIVVQYEHANQNNYLGNTVITAGADGNNCNANRVHTVTYGSARSGACAGTMDQVGAFVDYHFTKRFDVYGGFSYSTLGGGLAAGYINATDFSPTVGARFVF
jgi:predicted porin